MIQCLFVSIVYPFLVALADALKVFFFFFGIDWTLAN